MQPDGQGVSTVAFVGTSYNLRDADCCDNSAPQLRATGVTVAAIRRTAHGLVPSRLAVMQLTTPRPNAFAPWLARNIQGDPNSVGCGYVSEHPC